MPFEEIDDVKYWRIQIKLSQIHKHALSPKNIEKIETGEIIGKLKLPKEVSTTTLNSKTTKYSVRALVVALFKVKAKPQVK